MHNNSLLSDRVLCIIALGDNMSMIMTAVLQEKQRIDRMLEGYLQAKDKLPKGVLSEKKVAHKTYYYLKYRDGKRVISQYIPVSEVEEIREQVEHRKHIEIMIRSLYEEQKIARSIMEEYA